MVELTAHNGHNVGSNPTKLINLIICFVYWLGRCFFNAERWVQFP